ncbi:1510_t:CDS:2 [Racocetra fulgida]|uniref:RNA helicase n=1 Tax=Racocetra fulgida TaxID=60492 RepID=A0A9N9FJ08_9GLOM|nr:1510_t:CDS:2 [Racocetra fulgida]
MKSKRRRSLADDTFDVSKNQNLTNISNKRVNKKQRKNFDLEFHDIAQRLKGFRKELPIWRVQAVKENETIVVMGEMGCGKKIPQFLLDAGFISDGAIALTQPRRVAAISLAKRVANEVGYSVRFDDTSSRATVIKYLTDGMLLRELLSDPLLLKYCVIILDEAHERTMRTDILFGMVKRVQDARKNDKSYAVFTTSTQIHANQPPGQDDIEILEKLITEYDTTLPPDKLKIIPCLLFAALPTEQQTKVFDPSPPGTRKIILATNIAETSITINGVRYVVDTGKCKMKKFNSRVGMESLSIENISKDSADQRMGRAGREAPGFCYRLYTEEEYNRMEKNTEPEIKRCNLASIILLLKAFGIENVLEFDYLDAPALEQLFILKALDNQGKISDLGRKMSEFPLEPAYAKVLIMSEVL